jgi:cell division protein FtsQ
MSSFPGRLNLRRIKPAMEGASRRASPAKADAGNLLIMKYVAVALAAGLCVQLIVSLVVLPALRIKNYQVESSAGLSREEILLAAGIHERENYLSFDADAVRRNLESHSLIYKAYVEKIFPDTVKLIAYGRIPLAMAFAEMGGRTVPLVFDASGTVFQVGEDVSSWRLPLVSGIRFENPHEGLRLPKFLSPMLESLETVRKTDPALLDVISEIRIVKKTGNEFELLLYPAAYRVPIRTGSVLQGELLRSTVLVLDVLASKGNMDSVTEIDFRTGSVVYRTKEGRSD